MKLEEPNDVHLWLCRVDALTDPAFLNEVNAWLSLEEAHRYRRLVQPERRRRFLAARALTRWALARYPGVPHPAQIEFEYNAFGKPVLAGRQAPLQFNLSHSCGLLALAITRKGPIGVDVEHLGSVRKRNTSGIARRFFSRLEVDELARLDAELRHSLFVDVWTLKEAYIKAMGKGLSLPLDSFSVLDRAGRFGLCHPDGRRVNAEWRLERIRLGPDYRLAVAMPSDRPINCQVRQELPC